MAEANVGEGIIEAKSRFRQRHQKVFDILENLCQWRHSPGLAEAPISQWRRRALRKTSTWGPQNVGGRQLLDKIIDGAVRRRRCGEEGDRDTRQVQGMPKNAAGGRHPCKRRCFLEDQEMCDEVRNPYCISGQMPPVQRCALIAEIGDERALLMRQIFENIGAEA